jgi:hypothetical protein
MHLDVEMLGSVAVDDIDMGWGNSPVVAAGSTRAKAILAEIENAFMLELESSCEPAEQIAEYNLAALRRYKPSLNVKSPDDFMSGKLWSNSDER